MVNYNLITDGIIGAAIEVAAAVVIEVKSVDLLAPVFEAQLVTYLSLGGWQVGLLINFNVLLLKDGIRRRVVNYRETL